MGATRWPGKKQDCDLKFGPIFAELRTEIRLSSLRERCVGPMMSRYTGVHRVYVKVSCRRCEQTVRCVYSVYSRASG